MVQRCNGRLMAWFGAYVVAVGVLFLALPRLLAEPYLRPWDYSCVFLLVTPTIAVAALAPGVRARRYNALAVGLFYLAAVAVGLWLGWFSSQLSGLV